MFEQVSIQLGMKRGFHEQFSVVMKDEANSVCKFIKVNLKERERESERGE